MKAPVRLAAAVEGLTFAVVPLFPSFITLTNVQYPGISVIPAGVAVALFIVMLLTRIGIGAACLIPPRVGSPLAVPLLAVFGSAVLATVFGVSPLAGVLFCTICGLGVIWHLCIMRFYGEGSVARAIWWAFIVSGLCASLCAIAMVLLRTPTTQYAIANGRAVGTFVLPGELAGYLIVFLSCAYGVACVTQDRALRMVAYAGCASGVLAMAMTFSRTGWMGLGCAIAAFVALRARGARAALMSAGAVVVAALALVLVLFNEHHNPSENFTRLSIWQAALGIIDRFPLTGVGPFGFATVYAQLRLPDGDPTAFHAHSLYLTLFAETGIVGIGTFVWMIARFGFEMSRRLRDAESDASLLACAIVAGVVGSLVQGLIDTVSVILFGLLFPTLALALASARRGMAEA